MACVDNPNLFSFLFAFYILFPVFNQSIYDDLNCKFFSCCCFCRRLRLLSVFAAAAATMCQGFASS